MLISRRSDASGGRAHDGRYRGKKEPKSQGHMQTHPVPSAVDGKLFSPRPFCQCREAPRQKRNPHHSQKSARPMRHGLMIMAHAAVVATSAHTSRPRKGTWTWGQDNAHEGPKKKFHRKPSPSPKTFPHPGNALIMKRGRRVVLVDHGQAVLAGAGRLLGHFGVKGHDLHCSEHAAKIGAARGQRQITLGRMHACLLLSSPLAGSGLALVPGGEEMSRERP